MNEYLVTMTTHVPDGTSEQSVDLIKAREAVRANELAVQGHLLRLWLKSLTPWPIGPHFPEHKGYAVGGSKTLVEV